MKVDLNVEYHDLSRAEAAHLGAEAPGCIIFISLTKKYGRRSVYILSTALFTTATWWTAFINTAPELYLSSILMGFAGAVNEAAV